MSQSLQILLSINFQQNNQNLQAKIKMGFIQTAYQGIGLGYSVAGLALVLPSVFLFKQYFRALDHIQLVFLYAIVLAPLDGSFGFYLDISWMKFIPNFLTFCNAGQIVCTLGFALSFTICSAGFLLLLFFIITIQKCRKPQLRFEPVYALFKGVYRWTFLPLAYYSLFYLITDIKNGTSTNLIPSIIILAVTTLFPIIQLIVYFVIETQKDFYWSKWFEFLGYMRHLSIALILVLSTVIDTSSIAKYFVYGPLVLYAAFYLWKCVYRFKVAERIVFGLGQAIGITIFSLYLFDVQDIKTYELDFIGLGAIILLDIIYFILRAVDSTRGQVGNDRVNPQQTNKRQRANKFEDSNQVLNGGQFKIKKNKYDESQDLQNSRDSLVNTVRKGNQRRKK